MAYIPQFIITPLLLSEVEQVAALRERIQSAVVDPAWIPALQKDSWLLEIPYFECNFDYADQYKYCWLDARVI